MIVSAYFNFFDNPYRTQSLLQFKHAYESLVVGITSTEKLDLHFTSKNKIFLKENLLNLAILRINEKYIFILDNDIFFSDNSWMQKAIQELDKNDVVQLFDTCYHLDSQGNIIDCDHGFVYAKKKLNAHGHSGFAWGMTQQAFLHLGGLYEYNILGSGDAIMARAFTQQKIPSFQESKLINNKLSFFPFSFGHEKAIQQFVEKSKCLKTSFINNSVFHEYHGDLKKREYINRYKIYEKHNFDPFEMLDKDKNGVLYIKEKFNSLRNDIELFLKHKDEC